VQGARACPAIRQAAATAGIDRVVLASLGSNALLRARVVAVRVAAPSRDTRPPLRVTPGPLRVAAALVCSAFEHRPGGNERPALVFDGPATFPIIDAPGPTVGDLPGIWRCRRCLPDPPRHQPPAGRAD
jgi:hypothetical protein